MSQLTQQQIDQIAKQVVGMFQKPKSQPSFLNPDFSGKNSDERPPQTAGVFSDINSAVKSAQKAFSLLRSMSLDTRKKIIANIRSKMLLHAEDLAQRAFAETGMGRVEDKIIKNKLVIEKTPGVEILKPSANTGDRGLTLLERAPYGVIGAITPCTNPTSTIICNTIGMIAAGNSVVFNVHPTAKDVSVYNIELLNQAIIEAGGPENLVTTIVKPTIQSAQELMRHSGVNLLVVTGGEAVVKAAMQSGKRAICAGPGNPPVVVDETADIENAARSIIRGASTDNNIICVLEKEIFVVESVADQLISAFLRHDAVVLKPHEIEKLDRVIFSKLNGMRTAGVVEKSMIGKSVQHILSRIGLKLDDKKRLAIAPVPVGHPLVWTEQMLPIMPLVRMPNVDQAIDIAREAEHGFRHTAIMHSKNLDNLSRMARIMDCSIFIKNGPSLAGLGYGGEGHCSFTIASPTGEGITSPISFTRERRCVLVDHFRIV